MYNNIVKEPIYFHREYENDFPKKATNVEDSSQALRVAKVALPFIALYRPLGTTLACGLGAARTIATLRECFAAEDFQKLSWALFNTSLAIASVAGTILLHPLGMLITTLNDIGVNIHDIYRAISRGEMYEAGKTAMRIANNTFYLSMMLIGSIELQLASLTLQVLIEGSSSYEEFNKGNILEMIGHIGMSMVRMNQSYAQFGMLQRQKASNLEVTCIKKGQWHPALGSLKEQHKDYLVYADLRIAGDDESYFFNDEMDFNLLPEVKAVGDKGDLVAVWLDADASGISKDLIGDIDAVKDHFAGLDKSLYLSQYSAATGLWSKPDGLSVGKEGLNWSLMSADSFGSALVLLKDENFLEAVTFDKKWSSPVRLADHLPDITAFDADALGNCTLAWKDKDDLFTVRTYDTNTKTWEINCLQCVQSDLTDLVVRRDTDGNIAVLAEAGEAAYALLFNGKAMQWADPKSIDLDGDEHIVDLISMGNGRFTGIFANENVIRSLLLDVHNIYFDWNLRRIKSSMAEIDEIVVDKDRFGNPVVAWKESIDESELFDWDDLQRSDGKLPDMAAIMDKIFHSTKIHIANFDSAKGDWNSVEVASGIVIDHPKLGKSNGDLYLFWDEFLAPDEDDYSIFPINFNGMKLEEAKGEWHPVGTIFQCPMKESPFGSNYYYTKSIHDDGLHVIWKDGEECIKKTTPLR